ncbi:hypothetical protein, partial [uncultured Aquimarina sp.]|uniref:beta strand repeat-containing protein n=1 Tax=uncultured Aquimarina sp. TaxID=575652 RepID=UPI002611B6E3
APVEDDETSATPTVALTSDLSIAKSAVLTTDADGSTTISAGDTVTFSVTVSNAGANNATGVGVGDTVPDGYTTIGSISNSGSESGGLISWSGLSVTTTTPLVLTYTAVVTATGNYTNFAEITASDNFDPDSTPDGTPDTDAPVEDDETNFTPSVPELLLIKSVSNVTSAGATGLLDDVIEYTFTVENTGNVSIDTITIDDTLTGSTDLPVTPSTLLPGEIGTATATYTITQTDIDTGSVTNSATVEGEDPNGDPVVDVSDDGDETVDGPDADSDPTNDPTLLDLDQDAELTMTKTSVLGGTGAVGDIITYTFTVENTGNVSIDTITIDDTLTGSTDLPVTPSSLAPGEIGTATATYTITQTDIDTGSVTNSAIAEGEDPNGDPVVDVSDDGDETVDGPDADSDPTNDPTITDLTPNPELRLTKTSVVGGTGAVGDIITYTFTVENTGNVSIDTITIDDTLTGSTDLPVTPSTLLPGEIGTATATYTITQTDIDTGSVTNSATVEGEDPNGDPVVDVSDDGDETTDGPDADSDPTNDPTITDLTPNPELTMTKTSVVGGTGAVGDIITYTFTVENTGNVSIDTITIDDTLTGSTDLPVTPSSLAPGEIGTATATYVITQTDVDTGSVTNSATVEGEGPNGDPVVDVSDNGDETTDGPDADSDPTNDPTITDLTPNPELTMTKTSVVGGTGAVGDIITYTFTVENTGTVTVDTITIDDTLTGSTDLPVTPSILLPGEIGTATATYVITQTDVDTGSVTNSATVEGEDPNGDPVVDVSDDGDETTDGPDADSDPTNDPTITDLTPNPELTMTKTSVVGGTGAVGDIITYTFTVENTGTVTVDTITIDDTLTGSTDLPVTPSSLAPGEIGTATATYTITQTDINTGSVTNSATVEGEDPNGDPVIDVSDDGDETVDGPDADSDPTNDPTVTILTNDPELTLVKTSVLSGSNVGDIITYTFT